MKPNILVFDVESTNLHGSGFAVGAIVVNRGGTEIARASPSLLNSSKRSTNVKSKRSGSNGA